jgi:hypothetical protein
MAGNTWSYVDAEDLADALVLASVSELPRHEVFYIAAPDNLVGRSHADLVPQYYGNRVELRPTSRQDAWGISCSKAGWLLGYVSRRSCHDYLDDDETCRASAQPGAPTQARIPKREGRHVKVIESLNRPSPETLRHGHRSRKCNKERVNE